MKVFSHQNIKIPLKGCILIPAAFIFIPATYAYMYVCIHVCRQTYMDIYEGLVIFSETELKFCWETSFCQFQTSHVWNWWKLFSQQILSSVFEKITKPSLYQTEWKTSMLNGHVCVYVCTIIHIWQTYILMYAYMHTYIHIYACMYNIKLVFPG